MLTGGRNPRRIYKLPKPNDGWNVKHFKNTADEQSMRGNRMLNKKTAVIVATIFLLGGLGAANLEFKDSNPVEFFTDLNINGNTIDMGNGNLTGLKSPNADSDAATKGYVDGKTGGTEGLQNLKEVLGQGSTANQSINMDGNNVTSNGGEICVGNAC